MQLLRDQQLAQLNKHKSIVFGKWGVCLCSERAHFQYTVIFSFTNINMKYLQYKKVQGNFFLNQLKSSRHSETLPEQKTKGECRKYNLVTQIRRCEDVCLKIGIYGWEK